MNSKNLLLCFLLIIIGYHSVEGQSEEIIKKYFEGKYVTVKIEMPASKEGINIYPNKSRPLDFDEYSKRIKQYGTALYSGDRVMVTKVKTKKKHIEFQLGGGGYGTWEDESAYVDVPYVEKTEREKNLEKAVKNETDEDAKKALEEKLDDLRRSRESEQKSLRLDAEQARVAKQARIQQLALQSGSRFNIRYDVDLSSREITPEAIMAALSNYVDFENQPAGNITASTAGETDPKPQKLQKGLAWEEVAAMLGIPKSMTQREDCGFKVVSCSFEKDDQTIDAEFVEGILIKYSIASK